MSYYGNLILRERLARSWSQAGLCKGICTVSYLSKIETGKAQPSADVLRLHICAALTLSRFLQAFWLWSIHLLAARPV